MVLHQVVHCVRICQQHLCILLLLSADVNVTHPKTLQVPIGGKDSVMQAGRVVMSLKCAWREAVSLKSCMQ